MEDGVLRSKDYAEGLPPGRRVRAEGLLASKGDSICRVSPGVYFMPGSNGECYDTRLDPVRECTCLGFQNREYCKHLDGATMLELDRLERERAQLRVGDRVRVAVADEEYGGRVGRVATVLASGPAMPFGYHVLLDATRRPMPFLRDELEREPEDLMDRGAA